MTPTLGGRSRHVAPVANRFELAMARVASSDVGSRRTKLRANFLRPFSWFVEHFRVTGQLGGQLR
jgi:hypothetical protein